MAFGLWRIKVAAKHAIARRRRSPIVRALLNLSNFFESAWHNQDQICSTNGEFALLARLGSMNFRTVVDVGANVGEWAEAALGVWPTCFVQAFEIAPPTAAQFRKNFSGSPELHRLSLHEMGLSDAEGTLAMYFYPENAKLTSDVRRHTDLLAEQFEARTVTLDAFCQRSGLERIDYLKIDVEGAELKVLRGAAQLLRDGRLDCIQFEYGPFGIDSRTLLRDFYDLLGDTHVIGKIFPNYVEFREYDWTMEDFRFGNYLCVPRNRPDLQRAARGE